MRLNDIGPAAGARKERTRVGRGIAAGRGKTAGRGTKGQHARAGGGSKRGFEGGQMPLQRRLPRSGFASHIAASRAEVRLGALERLEAELVDVAALVAAGLVPPGTERVKLILKGEISRALSLGADVVPTRGARAAIEKAGGAVGMPGETPAPKARKKKAATKKTVAKKAATKKTASKKTPRKSSSGSEAQD